jgi:ABC-type glycerol-3-phosphate transport system permease component
LYTAAQAAGEQVDVLMLNGQDLRRYATSNALTGLDDVSFKTRFLPEALTTFTIDGKLWGFPSGALGGFIVHNYADAWQQAHIAQFTINSTIVAAGTVILTLFCAGTASYALSRFSFLVTESSI